jgi:hypothetical protein
MIIGIAFLWVSFFSINQTPKWLDFKPFNCVVCLSFWTCLTAYIIHHYCEPLRPLIEALSIGGFGAYTSIIIKRIMFKI